MSYNTTLHNHLLSINQIFNFPDFSIKRPFHLVDDGVDNCGV